MREEKLNWIFYANVFLEKNYLVMTSEIFYKIFLYSMKNSLEINRNGKMFCLGSE